MAFAHIHDGTFSGLEDATPTKRIFIQRGTVDQVYMPFNVTASGDGTVFHGETSRRYSYPVSGFGWHQDTDDSGSSYTFLHSTGNMGSLSGSLYAVTSKVVLIRKIERINVTSAADSIPDVSYEGGTVTYHGQVGGWLSSTETPTDADLNSSPSTLVVPLGEGTVSSSVLVTRSGGAVDFARNGPVPVNYNFTATDTVTATNTLFLINTFSASLNLDNGQTMSGTVFLDELRCDIDFERGGPIPFSFSGVFTGTVSFS